MSASTQATLVLLLYAVAGRLLLRPIAGVLAGCTQRCGAPMLVVVLGEFGWMDSRSTVAQLCRYPFQSFP